jgi:putative PEP-CTERM system histidine kinase
MSVIEPATIGYLFSLAAFLALMTGIMRQTGTQPVFRAVFVASMVTALWSASVIFVKMGGFSEYYLLTAIKWLRNLAWMLAVALVVAEIHSLYEHSSINKPLLVRTALGIILVLTTVTVWNVTAPGASVEQLLSIVIALLVLGSFETIIRNSPPQFKRIVVYICVVAGGIFITSFIISLPVGLLKKFSMVLQEAEGYVLAISALPLVLTLRDPVRPVYSGLKTDRFVYRSLLFVTLTAATLSLLLADYYVRSLGGSWLGVARVVAITGIGCFLAALSVSPALRGRSRVFLTKSFLRYKYDYRKEWLRFIGTLSETGLDHLTSTSVRAIARIVNSPAGVVWLVDSDSQRFAPVGAWQCTLPLRMTFSADSSLVKFMVERQWVIDLSEKQRHPSLYGDLDLGDWFAEDEDWWIIVPLLLGNELYGFVALKHAATISSLNFEDHDLLRTVGRHVATHLKQAESDRQLSEAQQFSTYHRLSAFLMHDLNNLAAQLSLVVKNAEKHKQDPKFVDDMIATVANSATRMNGLLVQLSNVTTPSHAEDVDLVAVVQKAIEQCRSWRPHPSLTLDASNLLMSADPERLCGVFEHLIRNAQDATDESGKVELTIKQLDQWAMITVQDCGCGMTDEFISERLFRPFDSTKGSQSMGIGAYQAREYIRVLGGQIDVTSIPGAGTIFTIKLPVSR